MDVVKLDIDINFLGNQAELALKVSLEIIMVIWGWVLWVLQVMAPTFF
jgi:hypothetical protein